MTRADVKRLALRTVRKWGGPWLRIGYLPQCPFCQHFSRDSNQYAQCARREELFDSPPHTGLEGNARCVMQQPKKL